MLPNWVDTLAAYERWVVNELHDLGADVEPEPLVGYDVPIFYSGGYEYSGLAVPRHLVRFHHGMEFEFDFTVYFSHHAPPPLDFEYGTYSYGLREADGTWIWRHDKHDEPHHGFRLASHQHVGPSEIPEEEHDVDIGDVVRHLRETLKERDLL